jgi:hypothetical protein
MLPIGVTRESSSVAQTGPVCSSAPFTIVLNLYSVKILPFLPTLFCLYKVGPPQTILISKAITSISGAARKRIVTEPTISRARMKISLAFDLSDTEAGDE